MSILDDVADIEQPVCTFITGVRTWEYGEVDYMAGHNGDALSPRQRRIAGDPAVLHVYTGSFESIYKGAARHRQVVIAKSTPTPGENNEEFEWVFTGPADEAWAIFYAHAAMLPPLS